MNKLDKLVEDRIRAEGWVKLLPTEKSETTQPHRFRYTDQRSVNIIQYGALAGVYIGPYSKEKYKEVGWDTPECECSQCQLSSGIEELEGASQAAAFFVRRSEGLSFDDTIDIAHLQIEQEDNDYKKVSFYYKVVKGRE